MSLCAIALAHQLSCSMPETVRQAETPPYKKPFINKFYKDYKNVRVGIGKLPTGGVGLYLTYRRKK